MGTEINCPSTFQTIKQTFVGMAKEYGPAISNALVKNAPPIGCVLGGLGAAGIALQSARDAAKNVGKLQFRAAAWNTAKTAVAASSAAVLFYSANHTDEILNGMAASIEKARTVAKETWANPSGKTKEAVTFLGETANRQIDKLDQGAKALYQSMIQSTTVPEECRAD